MTARALVRRLRDQGCEPVRSHQIWRCGNCQTVVPLHAGDIPAGTLRAIERDQDGMRAGNGPRFKIAVAAIDPHVTCPRVPPIQVQVAFSGDEGERI